MAESQKEEGEKNLFHEIVIRPIQEFGDKVMGFLAPKANPSQHDKKTGYEWLSDHELLIIDFKRVFGEPPEYNIHDRKNKKFFKYVQKMQHRLSDIIFINFQKNETIDFRDTYYTTIYLTQNKYDKYKEYLTCMNDLACILNIHQEKYRNTTAEQLPPSTPPQKKPPPPMQPYTSSKFSQHHERSKDHMFLDILLMWLNSRNLSQQSRDALDKTKYKPESERILEPQVIHDLVSAGFLPGDTDVHRENHLDYLLRKAYAWYPPP